MEQLTLQECEKNDLGRDCDLVWAAFTGPSFLSSLSPETTSSLSGSGTILRLSSPSLASFGLLSGRCGSLGVCASRRACFMNTKVCSGFLRVSVHIGGACLDLHVQLEVQPRPTKHVRAKRARVGYKGAPNCTPSIVRFDLMINFQRRSK